MERLALARTSKQLNIMDAVVCVSASTVLRKGGIVVIDPGNISNQIIRVRLAVHALELGARSEPWMIV